MWGAAQCHRTKPRPLRSPARRRAKPGALAPMREPGQVATLNRDAAEPPASGAPPSAPGRARSPRRFVLPLVAMAALGYGVYWGYNWFVEGRFLVSTDDAYVGADASIIAAKVAGHIVEVPVAENQKVHAGDLLARIDDGDYRLAVDAAKAKIATQDATIARIGRQIEAQNAAIDQAAAQVASTDAQAEGAVADEKRAALELDRSQKLADVAFGSQQRLEQATADRARAAATLAAALASKTAAVAALAGAKDAAEVLKAEQTEAERVRGELVTAEAKAERDLSFTEIRAPFDGVVGNKAAVVGQYAMPGTRLLARRAAAGGLCRRQFQGDPARCDPPRADRSTSRSIPSTGGSCPASSNRSRPLRGRSSRFCRPTTPPAISPRSCSA